METNRCARCEKLTAKVEGIGADLARVTEMLDSIKQRVGSIVIDGEQRTYSSQESEFRVGYRGTDRPAGYDTISDIVVSAPGFNSPNVGLFVCGRPVYRSCAQVVDGCTEWHFPFIKHVKLPVHDTWIRMGFNSTGSVPFHTIKITYVDGNFWEEGMSIEYTPKTDEERSGLFGNGCGKLRFTVINGRLVVGGVHG